MQTPPIPANEAERLAALRGFAVLDTPAEAAFDRFTRLAAKLFDVPIALVSLIDEERQWFKSELGLGAQQTPREFAFCAHAIEEKEPMVVSNALKDPRFHDNPLVSGDPHIRFYAGSPLVTHDGHAVGTLCVIDRRPRELNETQRELLTELGKLVMEQLEHRKARMLAEREFQQLRQLLTVLPAPVTVHQNGNVVFANARAEEVMRVPVGALTGQSARTFLVPKTQTTGSTPERIERKLKTGDGKEVLVESTPMPFVWNGDDAYVVLHRDVSAERAVQAEQKRASELVKKHLNELQVIFDQLPEGIVVADQDKRCVYANQKVSEIMGISQDTLLDWTLADVANHVADCTEDPEATREKMLKQVQIGAGTSMAEEFVFVKPKYQVLRRHVHKLGLPERPWISVWTDVTEQATQLKQSQLAASTDQLTSLANRRAAEAEMERAIAGGGPVSVVLFDVDHFKKVNDTFGHDVGDVVLQLVAEALRSSARSGDFVARWGGEEFLAVVRSDPAGAQRFAERVRLAVSKLETPAGKITISGGISAVKRPGDVKRADEQLYEAKRQGRNRVLGA
ncbi:MAG: diguanylate cyclase domain-containing protein [Archangium sp.]